VRAEVRLYDRLFTRPDPGADGDLVADINRDSETVLTECLLEPTLAELPVGETVQFERLGYFCADPDSSPGGSSSTGHSASETPGPSSKRRAALAESSAANPLRRGERSWFGWLRGATSPSTMPTRAVS
jgi:hypothetical protein